MTSYIHGVKTVSLRSSVYRSKQGITSVDFNGVSFQDNTMSYAFDNCISLVSVTNIPNSVTNMVCTFYNCLSLVNSPVIPNSVSTMSNAYRNCRALVNGPNLSECTNITNMSSTFHQCYSLTNIPVIPNSVSTMSNAFYYCNTLVNAPDMTNATNITNMHQAFYYCNNLAGNIYIGSENISNAYSCFYGTEIKNVYIPFTNPVTGEETLTAITFGKHYDTVGTYNKVYLKDIRTQYSDNWEYRYNGISEGAVLLKYTGTNNNITVPYIIPSGDTNV